jgi:hypothetical protein
MFNRYVIRDSTDRKSCEQARKKDSPAMHYNQRRNSAAFGCEQSYGLFGYGTRYLRSSYLVNLRDILFKKILQIFLTSIYYQIKNIMKIHHKFSLSNLNQSEQIDGTAPRLFYSRYKNSFI